MSETILADARERPDLFVWVGTVDPDRFCAWLRDAGLAIPSDLREIRTEFAGRYGLVAPVSREV